MITRFFQSRVTLGQFSKFLNLQTPVSKLGKKLSPQREFVTRIKNAGERVVSKGGTVHEGMYVLNKKGKASKYIKGEATSVATPFNSGKGKVYLPEVKNMNEVMSSLQSKQKPPKLDIGYGGYEIDTIYRPKKSILVHNHPFSSSLSIPDITLAKNKNNQIIARDQYGSSFRGYGLDGNKHYRASMLSQSRLHQDQAMLKNLSKQGYTTEEAEFMITHARNKALKNMGLIHYSAQVKSPFYTPEFKSKTNLLARKFQKQYSKYDKAYFDKFVPEFPDTPRSPLLGRTT